MSSNLKFFVYSFLIRTFKYFFLCEALDNLRGPVVPGGHSHDVLRVEEAVHVQEAVVLRETIYILQARSIKYLKAVLQSRWCRHYSRSRA